MATPISSGRRLLAERLRERRGEIEQALLTRVGAVARDTQVRDPEYLEGRWATLRAALDYCLLAVEHEGDRRPPIPDVLLAQARLAARYRVSLDVILRRYFAGYTLLSDFLMAEAEQGRLLPAPELQAVLRTSSLLFDDLISAVTDEYGRESSRRLDSSAERRLERIRGLIDGELLETGEFGYDFGAWHLGVVLTGRAAEAPMRELARRLERELLIVQCGEDTFSAWLGGCEPLSRDLVERALHDWPGNVVAGFGEPARDMSGWRLTYRQGCNAMRVAVRRSRLHEFYADVVVEATLLADDLFAASLRSMFLDPLEDGRDGGAALCETLRAYYSCEMNLSSAAALLGISRRTVANRLQAAEERLGRPLPAVALDVQAALRLRELDLLAGGGALAAPAGHSPARSAA